MIAPLSILVLDDDPGVLGAVSEVVEAVGHRPFVAATPDQALEIAALHELQASILDMHLGACTGLETLVRLRGIHRQLAAILMSGALTNEIRIAACAVGVRRILGKPLDLDALRTAVGELPG